MRTGVSGSGKRVSLPVLAAAVVALSIVAPVRPEAATVACYLRIEGIPGDAVVSTQRDWIEVQTWGFGETQAGSARSSGGMAAAAGRVQMQDIRFTARMGKHSPALFQECATGRHLQSATLTCQKPGKTPFEFLRIKIDDVFVTGYQTGTPAPAGPGAQVGLDNYPVDQVSLGFGKIQVGFNYQGPDGRPAGSVSGSWDLKTNRMK